eukprot:GILJ01020701.1.p1 GENE.GILJ01020701.1~~GILJ01020701.1.p1  ORF type:complete len:218 (+),score=40.30 GILJ01020701.1:301-954(+)
METDLRDVSAVVVDELQLEPVIWAIEENKKLVKYRRYLLIQQTMAWTDVLLLVVVYRIDMEGKVKGRKIDIGFHQKHKDVLPGLALNPLTKHLYMLKENKGEKYKCYELVETAMCPVTKGMKVLHKYPIKGDIKRLIDLEFDLSDGTIWAVDSMEKRVYKMGLDGKIIMGWVFDFEMARGVAISHDKIFIVTTVEEDKDGKPMLLEFEKPKIEMVEA